ncbi:hypothetical protein ARMGADRAFT_1022661 [Armillaria gallica]|uniref:Uncharacterized protein n=1 Tax=Armillaria gallica TaxID=47427 RepID=A0A2H3EV14_ARMGA|nr:hypothetical protein ARMGADRAFT_1022661 [Armillaria gallica]
MVYRVTNELEVSTPDHLLAEKTVVYTTTAQEHGDQPVNATADPSDASVLECVEHANASVDVLGNIDASGPSESSTQFRSTVTAVRALSMDLPDREASVEREVIISEPSESLTQLGPADMAIRVPSMYFFGREQSIGQPVTAFLPLEPAARHTLPEVWLIVFAQIYHDVGYCLPLGKKKAPAFVISHAIGVISSPRHVSAFAVAPLLKLIAFAGFDARTTFDILGANITSYDDARDCYTAQDVHNIIVRNLHASPALQSF